MDTLAESRHGDESYPSLGDLRLDDSRKSTDHDTSFQLASDQARNEVNPLHFGILSCIQPTYPLAHRISRTSNARNNDQRYGVLTPKELSSLALAEFSADSLDPANDISPTTQLIVEDTASSAAASVLMEHGQDGV